jgi:DHA2 family multidrug resistance protein
VSSTKGQEWDWFGDPFWRAQTFFITTVIGLVAFAIWELRHPNPMVNLRLLGERNFLACGVILYLSFAVLYGENVATPQMLQELFGYDAFHAGLVLSPPAFVTMGTMPIVGFLLGKKVDARYIVPLGLVCVAGACYWRAHLDLYVSPLAVMAPRYLQMLGIGMLFVTLNNAAYLYLSQHQVNNATGLFNMLRNEGGSLGIAIVTVLTDRRSQFHQLRLAEHVTRLNPAVNRWTDYFAQTRMIRGGVTQAVAQQQGWGLLSQMVHNQAREMAYLDPFWMFWVMALAALLLILLMKKAVASGGVAVH